MSPTASLSSVATATVTSIAGSSTEGDHGMDMGGDDCKISMLWNWYTVDACFVSHTWRISTTAMFAGSCIGVILLVLLLEFLRRAAKEYDAHILRAYQHKISAASSSTSSPGSSADEEGGRKKEVIITKSFMKGRRSTNVFRPSIFQQMVRAAFHTLVFAAGYFLMLLAMYYNGYIIISIFIGAYMGFFIFGWEAMELGPTTREPAEETTKCCE
ncbi:hypothetical protein FKW77_005641 [Venturia effusa]|uniref:Copper transport protein n=1 Tax=Venturia effusa TaxID=50376 RepID=A0A517LK97_9PEZI|nr:hypothetical protein FKW77_005641 [Venturia effusa]